MISIRFAGAGSALFEQDTEGCEIVRADNPPRGSGRTSLGRQIDHRAILGNVHRVMQSISSTQVPTRSRSVRAPIRAHQHGRRT